MNDPDLDVSSIVEHIMNLPADERARILTELSAMVATIKAGERRAYEDAARHLREVFSGPDR